MKIRLCSFCAYETHFWDIDFFYQKKHDVQNFSIEVLEPGVFCITGLQAKQMVFLEEIFDIDGDFYFITYNKAKIALLNTSPRSAFEFLIFEKNYFRSFILIFISILKKIKKHHFKISLAADFLFFGIFLLLIFKSNWFFEQNHRRTAHTQESKMYEFYRKHVLDEK